MSVSTAQLDSSLQAVTAICERAMRAFATAVRSAAPDSPFSRARAALPKDRFYDVVIEALRASIKRDLLAAAGDYAATRSVAPLAGEAIIVAAVADATAAVVAAARVQS